MNVFIYEQNYNIKIDLLSERKKKAGNICRVLYSNNNFWIKFDENNYARKSCLTN